MAPNGIGKVFFPANPDLANILGDMDLDFENCYFWDAFGFRISSFPDFSFPEIWPGPSLGQAWAKLTLLWAALGRQARTAGGLLT